MRRYWVLALAVLTLLGGLAPPAFAQAPAPKVTIQGLFNLVTAWSSNFQDADSTRRETEWYSRQRGRLDFIGELGKTKMVWGIELDFTNGQGTHAGTSAGFDLDTDVAGQTETKWLYLEFPLTGKDSMLPMIDVPSVARGGGQPFAGHDYKSGILATGDFGGLNIVTTFAPTVKNTFTFVQIEENLFRGESAGPAAGANAANRESWAIIDSLEFSPTKELTVKPTFSVAIFQGANAGTAGIGTPGKGGLSQAVAAQAISGLGRWTAGGDLRWRSGPYSVEPTFHYQGGKFGNPLFGPPGSKKDVDIDAWIFDVIGGWRSGPLNLEGRFVYTTGNDANECVQVITGVCKGGSDVNYYTPINAGFVYFAGWSETWTSALDYAQTFLAGGTGAFRRGQTIGYDKYGLVTFAARATYAVTPAFSLVGIVSPAWTAEDVELNNSAAFALASGITPGVRAGETSARGDENYLGTEIVVGFAWSFAPGVKLDMRYSNLFAGDALNQCQLAACTVNAQIRGAKDVQRLTARVDYSF